MINIVNRIYNGHMIFHLMMHHSLAIQLSPSSSWGRDFTMGNPFSLTHWNHSLKIRISSSSPKCWHIYQTCSWEGLTDTPSSIQLFTSWSIQWMGSACNSCGKSSSFSGPLIFKNLIKDIKSQLHFFESDRYNGCIHL